MSPWGFNATPCYIVTRVRCKFKARKGEESDAECFCPQEYPMLCAVTEGNLILFHLAVLPRKAIHFYILLPSKGSAASRYSPREDLASQWRI
ncbi:hypothetical protein E2C01_042000 [Portunus trituberculatus]|uniref:Uncharacterized protein n=1 Tax=Portunus trituberculatus TaxID=210409 RepID=A0A5B7FP04_PORTR|nr:hypothetical protein [Portunus trituberculatus]